MLVLNAGRVVALDTLISGLWGDRPPDSARAMVHTYVSSLRRMFSEHPSPIVRQSPGYVLRVAPERVDLTRFERAVLAAGQALQDDDVELASTLLATAVALWHGPPLGGVEGEWAELERVKLAEARLAALEMRVDVEFRRGRGGRLVGELSALVAEHPMRESLRARLMRALHEAGRQADALEVFHQARRVLAEELGVAPGVELQAAFRAVLAHAGDAGEQPARQVDPTPGVGPSQLPPAIADFTGRLDEIDNVLRALRSTDSQLAARICAVSGKPGSGKTVLAVHAAHLLRREFPDGQLYVSLRGTHRRPADPADVLSRFLRALGVPDAKIPALLEERGDLFRSMLARRRVLLVLDDAANEQQIRPLIPAGVGCAVLATSRVRLVALEGASLVELRELPEDETLELLARLVTGARLAAEPQAAREIVRLCGHLPLAVRIVGARLAARPHWRISRLVQRLRQQRHLLNELTIGDLEVRSTLALSYDGLAELDRAALRWLSLMGVTEFASWLAASLLDLPMIDAEDVVERLVDAQLLDAVGADATGLTRYRIHDLTRAFASELGRTELTRTEVSDAIVRTCRDALELVRRATARTPSWVIHPVPGSTEMKHLDTATVDALLADPVAWFDTEQALLVNLVELASELKLVDTAAALASTLSSSSFAVRNQFSQWARTHNAALVAARRAGDGASEAQLLAGIGQLYYEQDRFDESLSYYQQGLAVYVEIGDVRGQAKTQLELSFVLRERGRYAEAENALARATPVLRDIGTPHEQARASHNLGMLRTEQGALVEAADVLDRALTLWRSIGNRRGAALALRSIGITHRAAGRLDDAAACCEQAVTELRGVNDRLMIVYAEQALAKVRIRQGRGHEVRPTLEAALMTCNQMQDSFGQALMLRTIGELELTCGEPDAAVRHLTRSLDWWQALDLPVWQARTIRDLAVAWTSLGNLHRAEELWSTARAIFEQHGCREATEPLPNPVAPTMTRRHSKNL